MTQGNYKRHGADIVYIGVLLSNTLADDLIRMTN